MKIKLAKGERIIAVVPESCSGPGWSNKILNVHIVGPDRSYREECLQPEEMTSKAGALFDVGEVIHNALIDAVETENE